MSKCGEAAFLTLARTFYKNIFKKGSPDFIQNFNKENVNNSAVMLSNYFIQRFGGPSYYTDSKSSKFPSLIKFHIEKKISIDTTEKWLNIMNQTLDELHEFFDIETREKIMSYFKITAYTYMMGNDSMNQIEKATGEFAFLFE